MGRLITPSVLIGEEASLLWEILSGKARFQTWEDYSNYLGYMFNLSYADKAIRSRHASATWDYGSYGQLLARSNLYRTMYLSVIDHTLANADFRVLKTIGGTFTLLGSEAVDLGTSYVYTTKLSCLGTSIKAYRIDMTTAKVSVTDTAIASGYFGVGNLNVTTASQAILSYLDILLSSKLVPAGSTPQKPIAYFECPIIGDGTAQEPFRAFLGEEVIIETDMGKVNLSALSHTNLIKSDQVSGKPVDYTSIVRIVEQPDRNPFLYEISRCLDDLRGVRGVKELTKDKAIMRAKQLDDLLGDEDFTIHSEVKKQKVGAEMKRRKDNYNVDVTEEDTIKWLMADKGW